MSLPFVARILGVHSTEEAVAAVNESIPMFDLKDSVEDELGRILFLSRKYEEDNAQSRLIVIPASALKRYTTPTKTDIRWIWKVFNGMRRNTRARWSNDAVLTMLWTNEPELYIASNDTVISSWAQPDWVWKWIKYVHALPAHLQKKGILRFILGETVEQKDDAEILAETLGVTRNQKRDDND